MLWYLLESPWRVDSNEYPQHMYWRKLSFNCHQIPTLSVSLVVVWTLFLAGFVLNAHLPVTDNCSASISDRERMAEKSSMISLNWIYHTKLCAKDAERRANHVDPDQTAPEGAFRIKWPKRNTCIKHPPIHLWINATCEEISLALNQLNYWTKQSWKGH